MAELVRENEELREEVKDFRYLAISLRRLFIFLYPYGLNLNLKVERRRVEVEGLLRERGEGWRARGRSEETLYESLSYQELEGEQRAKSWKEQVFFLVKVDALGVGGMSGKMKLGGLSGDLINPNCKKQNKLCNCQTMAIVGRIAKAVTAAIPHCNSATL